MENFVYVDHICSFPTVFQRGKPNAFNLSGYDMYLRHFTRRVARLWTFSNIILSLLYCGDQICLVGYSTNGQTIRLVMIKKHFLFHIGKGSKYELQTTRPKDKSAKDNSAHKKSRPKTTRPKLSQFQKTNRPKSHQL